MRIVFAGTSEFGVPTLEKLKKLHELVLIITQPDKPAGRSKQLTPPPIKIWAQKNNLPIAQSENIINLKSQIQALEPDLLLVAAYGQIIPKEILDIPKLKSVNIHGSLLPKYRGASPIQSAILNQDTETGITLIIMDEKMDHGPILSKAVWRLNGTETFPMLYQKLAELSADLVEKTLADYANGKINSAEQNHSMATYCRQLTRADAKIDWTKPAKEISAQIRALNPEPGTWTSLDGRIVKILKTKILPSMRIDLPGKIFAHEGFATVKTLDQSLILELVQPEGKLPMSGRDFFNGLQSGSKLLV